MPVSDQKSIRVTLPASGRDGEIPEPTHPLGAEAREMWDAWWRSPMAVMWEPSADVYPLTRLAALYEQMRVEGVSDRVTVEMRQLESMFGLTPKARKELGWTVAADEAEPTSSASDIAQKREERRRRLRAS